ncbi:hypothetical protein HFO98_26995 [Rhizobium leguminosarum]|uniref:hypothetical protein n=1 Tax=Rhizobium leguminosarum TaxID=384 RepID=UPI001C94EC39|nr:hypothetical protein [Rhizobium leguminosarum]MBY5412036.1 hypothetical protein [Rhizobium leguminosarum]
MTSKHPKSTRPTDADLERDPGIGQSKGLHRDTGADDIAGQNTEKGDVANDTNRFGGINPKQRGRANK